MDGVRQALQVHLAAIVAEVEEHIRNSLDEVLRRLT